LVKLIVSGKPERGVGLAGRGANRIFGASTTHNTVLYITTHKLRNSKKTVVTIKYLFQIKYRICSSSDV